MYPNLDLQAAQAAPAVVLAAPNQAGLPAGVQGQFAVPAGQQYVVVLQQPQAPQAKAQAVAQQQPAPAYIACAPAPAQQPASAPTARESGVIVTTAYPAAQSPAPPPVMAQESAGTITAPQVPTTPGTVPTVQVSVAQNTTDRRPSQGCAQKQGPALMLQGQHQQPTHQPRLAQQGLHVVRGHTGPGGVPMYYTVAPHSAAGNPQAQLSAALNRVHHDLAREEDRELRRRQARQRKNMPFIVCGVVTLFLISMLFYVLLNVCAASGSNNRVYYHRSYGYRY